MFRKSFPIAAAVVSSLAASSGADAAFLEWSKFSTKAHSEQACMNFASDVARNKGLQNVRKSALEVAGVKNNIYVSMTCIGRGQEAAVAMVMTMGDNAAATIAVREEIATALKGITCFEGC